ncbi:DUF1592 domain-containing protein [Mariniblastus fucicola]|uniref:Planctomycete cytochrome C n=1 Tax=Mariniblastus fucicola TaxID=980251 RepID=A0A5B9PLR3_9BACT|nr:DUF1592 domain-containing protein [Mariniblastus fucicola]QEG23233.1 hypothetical protein MFFC18_31290 [Mariniblastus fucicola]
MTYSSIKGAWLAVAVAIAWLPAGFVSAQVKTLIADSCIHCHDESTDTSLDFDALDFDLKDEKTFAMWERVYDRVAAGEMPPEDEDRPDQTTQKKALAQIHDSLSKRSLAIQKENGRSTIRRLTRTEYEYSLHDLLGIKTELARLLPAENESGFDTVAKNQGISQLHAKSWLIAADAAIDSAINLGVEPDSKPQRFEMLELESVKNHFAPEGGKNKHIILGKEDDGIVIFESGSTYLYSLKKSGMDHSGTFRIRAEAETFRSDTPIVVAFFAGSYSRGQSRILDYWDAVPGETLEIDFEPTLRRGEYIFPQAFELMKSKDNANIWNVGPEKYEGAGLKLKWVSIEGPLHNSWPPVSATNLLPGVKFNKREHLAWRNNRHIQFDIETPEGNPLATIRKGISKLAARAFRRPLRKGEADEYLVIAKNALDEGAAFDKASRLAMRSVLCSPHFLFHSGEPGELDDFSLASRLSYFFWKSIPDSTLLKLANAGELSDDEVLRQQVDRMLDDQKANRFFGDFLGQWLELRRIDATSPDSRLYPEYDPVLRSAMTEESEAFFGELVKEDLGVANLVDSDFAMLNRRLADHYGISGVEGQHIRRVDTKGTVRGGFLTQAAILKTTANGTTTSPVRRGNWVLTSILGTPSPPPPPNVGAIEPDTRGTTTIREELTAHRNSMVCNSCHKNIDPPGFALESFDVIGGFREKYRSVEHGDAPKTKLFGRHIWEYKLNLPVNPSGETPDGVSFSDIESYKRILAKRKRNLAENLVRQLVVYSTGAEIQFADRAKIDNILKQCEDDDYGVRSLIHAVVQSKLFRHK